MQGLKEVGSAQGRAVEGSEFACRHYIEVADVSWINIAVTFLSLKRFQYLFFSQNEDF